MLFSPSASITSGILFFDKEKTALENLGGSSWSAQSMYEISWVKD